MDISGNTLLQQTALIYPPFDDTSYNQYKNVLLIDNTTPSYQTFVDSANNDTFPVVYSKDCSGTELLELLRNRFTQIQRVGFVFVSNSNNSVLYLDNTQLFMNEEQEPYSTNVELVISIIREFSIQNVDFLSCNTLNYSNWQNYYNILSQNTGVIVGASDNKTGNLKYGGDWILESTSEDVELVYFTQSIKYYQYLLDGFFVILSSNTPTYGLIGLSSDGTYLYGSYYERQGIVRVNVSNPSDISYNWGNPDMTVLNISWTSAVYNGNLYIANTGGTNNIYRLSLSNPTVSFTKNWATPPGTSLAMTVGGTYLYMTQSSRRTICRINLNNPSDQTDFVTVVQGVGSNQCGLTTCNGNLYIFDATLNCIQRYSLTNPANDYSVNLISTNTLGGGGFTSRGLTNLYTINKTIYISDQVGSVYSLNPETLQSSLVSNTGSYGACGMVHINSKLYVGGLGSPGRIYAIDIPMQPSDTINIDLTNTYQVSSGNLLVRITDSTNTSDVVYQYSVNGRSFVNTGIYANLSTPFKNLFILSSDISNTILIRGNNIIGNSTPISIPTPKIIYQTPRTPPQVSFTLVNSGNVQVSINELATTPVPYYYLNDVSYYLYAYNNFGGNNLSGNTSTLVYNIPVGILSNTNTTYNTIVSYVNTGLNANTYTMYVIARNTVGNSNPVSANIAVYTTPVSPTIDVSNTQSLTSGTLTVFIRDASNSPTNGIYYLYSMDGISYGNSGVAKTTNTTYTFTINNTGNAQIPLVANTYTLRIAVSNPIGNTIANPATATEIVYTTPISPIIDVSNTQSTTSGTLTVSIIDSSNSPTNGIYYLYSMDGITYGNSGVAKTTNTTYSFTINNTGNAQIPLVANTYTLYIASSNPIGNTIASPATATEIVYTTPVSPIIDVSNTQSLTSGTLTVFIRDSSNSPTNGIYYLYSMDGITYGNSGVAKTTNTTYSFTINNTGNAQIPLVANTYTLYIASSNPIGNTIASPATATEIVYTTPVSPTIDISNTQSLTSGTLTVSIIDSSNSPINGIYYLYSMDGITYGNSGVAKTTNTTYSFTINNTGNAQIPLIAKTYTLYIAAANPVGNSIASSVTATKSVYITPSPPTINQGNTKSITSGNLNVAFTDTFNNGNNQVEYTYFLYDSTAPSLFYV